MSTSTEEVTISNIIIHIQGAHRFSTSNLVNLKLYRDTNSNTSYDGGDIQIGGTGVLAMADSQTGSITFSTSFVASSTQDYLLIGDTNAIKTVTSITLTVRPEDITAIGLTSTAVVTASGTISSIQHRRSGGGGGGSSIAVGGAPPPGDGDVSGGTNGGGELIGSDPNFYLPTANSGSWTNPANAYDSTDGTYASAVSTVTNDYTIYGFNVGSGNIVNGISVKLEISGTTVAGNIGIELSWDGGTSWTSSGYTTPTLTTTDTVVTVGGPSNTWGRSWSDTEFSDANFAVRLTGNPSANTIQVDAIQVRVHHQVGGGGSGGGGAI